MRRREPTPRVSAVSVLGKAGAGLVCMDAALALFLLAAPSFAMVRRIYDFNTICLPILLLVAAAAGVWTWRSARHWCRTLWPAAICVTVAVCLAGLRAYATHIEPHRLQVRRFVIDTDKVGSPLRILHISDIQSARVGPYERQAFEKMRELRPDLVLFTGDLLQVAPPADTAAELPKLAALFRTLSPRYGIYRVMGDVDWETNNASKAELGGVSTLEDSEATINTGGGKVRILGLRRSGAASGEAGGRAVKEWLTTTAPGDFTIVLGHAPDYALGVTDLPVDLCLAGHTHGGQIRVPLLGPIITMSGVPRKWARGFRRIGHAWLDVSAGVGSEHMDAVPPIRVACPPEMTLIEVVPSVKEQQKTKGGGKAPVTRGRYGIG